MTTDRATDRAVEVGCAFDLTIGAVFQNEAPYLKEWIEFHRMMGVQRFVLVNDRSTDHYLDVLGPYIETGEVAVFDYPCPSDLQGTSWIQYQVAVVRALCRELTGVTRWLALIDIDEFIVPSESVDLITLLSGFEDRGGLYVRWEPFGTSYIQKLPEGALVTESFRLKWRFVEGYDMLGKSIVKPHRVAQPNIHRCTTIPGYPYEDLNAGMRSPSPILRVHHYWSRDEAFLFKTKLARTSRIKGWGVHEAGEQYFRTLFNDVYDDSMLRFAPELRRRVFGP